MNTLLRIALLSLVLVTPAVFTGCSSSKTTTNTTATVGQQLIDLDRAYKDGVVSKDQYEKMKKELIRKND